MEFSQQNDIKKISSNIDKNYVSILTQKGISNNDILETDSESLKSVLKQACAYSFSDVQVRQMLKGLVSEADIDFEGKIDQKGIIRSDGFFETSFGLMPNRYIKAVDNSVSVNSIPAKFNSEYNKINQVQPMSFSNDYRSVTDSNDQTGTYWVVKSETGYKEATAFITLPTITSMASTDRAYLFFSANTVSSSIVGDYGVVYVPNTGWIPFTNTGVWNTNTQEYDWTWRNGTKSVCE